MSGRWDYQSEKRALFARGLFPPHQATIVSTESLRSVSGFNTEYSIAADYAAALALSQVADPVMTDRVIATFVEGGVSTTRWKESFREFHRARREIFEPKGFQSLGEHLNYWRHFTTVTFVRRLRR